MDSITAIDYLMKNGHAGSEWQEAGMWYATCQIMSDQTKLWTTGELDELIKQAENN